MTKSGKIHLVIIGALNFPRGSASSSRITAYSKGIIDNGGKVTIICLRPLGINSWGEGEIQASANINGINYIYTPGITVRPKSLFRRIFYELKGYLNSFPILFKLNRTNPIDAFLFYGTGAIYELFATGLAKILKAPVIRERSEYPFFDRTIFTNKIRALFHERIQVKLYDGMFIISKALENYYKVLIKKNTRYLMIPILVDTSRFENIKASNIYGKYIAYCGDPAGNKDGVPILIEAFSKIVSKHPEHKLLIIGDSTDKSILPNLKALVQKLNIAEKVSFTGKIPAEDMPGYLCNASVLALARPRNIQAAYGFPTKLGEYLSTGNPVVVTDVGEIGEFLTDSETAYISEPDSPEKFAAKLDQALTDPQRARIVGLSGKAVAVNNFSYGKHGQRMVKFIIDLNTKNFGYKGSL